MMIMKNTMPRRSFLRAVGATLAAGGLSPWIRAKQPTRKPLNILLIMADDLNTALSGYGHPQCRTPNLDALAQNGVSFTRAYCQFPLCGPSRASMMTGQYPLANGVQRNGDTIRDNVITLPQLFRQNGYWTGRMSKIYHMGVPGHIFTGDNGTDHEPSWDERYNVSAMETITPGKAEDLMLDDTVFLYDSLRTEWPAYEHQGDKFFIPEGNHQGSDFVVVETDGGDEVTADGMAATGGVELLRQRAKSGEPFFLAVGFVRPHVPLVAPRDLFTGYDADEMQLAESLEGDLNDIPNVAQKNTNANKYKLGTEEQRKVLRGYYACVSYMDQQVGRLLDELDQLDLRENTIVLFVSDHGYHLGEHTMWQKKSLMEESIRVPLIVSVPGGNSRNSQCDRIVELLDIYPTLAELAGLEPPSGIQGQSFAHLLDNAEAPARRTDALVQVDDGYCLRTDRWAYMRYASKSGTDFESMLYDMNVDPGQYTNLSGDGEYSDIENRLSERLKERIAAAEVSDGR